MVLRLWDTSHYLVVYTYICAYNKSMEIEFDLDKAAANPLNHDGVTFDEAKTVLLDPYALTREDNDADNEQRFVTLGMGAKGRILIVVWTLREESVRLISAWKANQSQRRRYEQQF
ncbi:MAG: BrnT family toxin [Arenimonas sp.]